MQGALSPFELAWRGCPTGNSIDPKRTTELDRASALIRQPIRYAYSLVDSASREPPDEVWVVATLERFVRGEFGSPDRDSVPPFPGLPIFTGKAAVGRAIVHDYLEESERTLVYGSHLSEVLERSQDDMPMQLYEIMCDPVLGNKSNRKNIRTEAFLSEIREHAIKRNRIRFVLPAFPFKDQNVFRTDSSASCVDMGELALIIRMHAMVLAYYQVHPHGADIILLTDGLAYADIFGVPRAEALEYHNTLLEWRNELNLERTVSIVDLSDLADRCDYPATSLSFHAIRRSISQTLRNLYEDGLLVDLRNTLSVLKRGMSWNLNLRGYVEDGSLPLVALWQIVRGNVRGERLTAAESRVAADIDERSLEAAFEYAAFNLALRYLDAFAKYLPQTVRATIHPKPGQVGVPSLGTVFPWNGVPVLDPTKPLATRVEVMPLVEISRRDYKVSRRTLVGSGSSNAFVYQSDPGV